MTLNLYIQCFFIAVLGQLFHLLVVKLPSAQKRARAANLGFDPIDYLKKDWMAVSANLLAIVIILFLMDELFKAKPFIIDYVKIVFATVGFTGSSILVAFLGKSDKVVRSIIDKKTNELDDLKKNNQ